MWGFSKVVRYKVGIVLWLQNIEDNGHMLGGIEEQTIGNHMALVLIPSLPFGFMAIGPHMTPSKGRKKN